MAAWVAPAIAAGASLLGGITGQNAADSRHRQQLKQAQRQFDQQMDNTINRRVQDAIRAGVHPLFALGGGLGASPTITSSGEAPTGGGMGDALQHIASIISNTPAQLAAARRDEAEAAYLNSQTKRVEQGLASQGRDALGSGGGTAKTFPLPDGHTTVTGEPVYYQPELPVTKPGTMGSTEAGVRSPYVEYRRDDGSKGKAFGAEVPGAEELNMIWIPLQNWWHTSKQARAKLRDKLGITSGLYSRFQSDPEFAKQWLADHAKQVQRLKKEFRNFNRAVSGPPIR